MRSDQAHPKFSRRKGLFMAAMLAAAVGLGSWIHQYLEADVLPLPRVIPGHPQMSLEWIPETIPLRRIPKDPQSHSGFRLAQEHCARCHLLPEPNHLPRETWPFVLTWMSNYLGYTNLYGPFANNVEGTLMPGTPLLPEADLRTLSEYFILYAPERRSEPAPPASRRDAATQFQAVPAPFDLPPEELITLVHFEETAARFYIGRGTQRVLQVFAADGRILLNKVTDSEPVDVSMVPGGFRMSLLGDFIENKQQGQVLDVTLGNDEELDVTPVVQGYHRLTQTAEDDLNADGVDDLLLVGFGAGAVGRVSIFWMTPEGSTQGETILIDEAGAVRAETQDFNRDGRTDVMVLVAQGKQELRLFLNHGNRQFEPRMLSKQIPGFGYNHFCLADFNQDGRQDILVSNGNNMEIKDAPTKPYHGVRILENTGDLKFSEKYFYPMDGALKSLAEDFDGDGDLDIAAIALYPDWSQPIPETFAYLENQGNYRFKPTVLPDNDWGRWITMTAADVDLDGDEDILLGGGYIPHGVHTQYKDAYQKKAKGRPSVVILKNRSR